MVNLSFTLYVMPWTDLLASMGAGKTCISALYEPLSPNELWNESFAASKAMLLRGSQGQQEVSLGSGAATQNNVLNT